MRQRGASFSARETVPRCPVDCKYRRLIVCFSRLGPDHLPYRETTMRKIRLDIDDLAVESFDTVRDETVKTGTVRGHDLTQVVDTCPNFSRGTCFQSCGT